MIISPSANHEDERQRLISMGRAMMKAANIELPNFCSPRRSPASSSSLPTTSMLLAQTSSVVEERVAALKAEEERVAKRLAAVKADEERVVVLGAEEKRLEVLKAEEERLLALKEPESAEDSLWLRAEIMFGFKSAEPSPSRSCSPSVNTNVPVAVEVHFPVHVDSVLFAAGGSGQSLKATSLDAELIAKEDAAKFAQDVTLEEAERQRIEVEKLVTLAEVACVAREQAAAAEANLQRQKSEAEMAVADATVKKLRAEAAKTAQRDSPDKTNPNPNLNPDSNWRPLRQSVVTPPKTWLKKLP